MEVTLACPGSSEWRLAQLLCASVGLADELVHPDILLEHLVPCLLGNLVAFVA